MISCNGEKKQQMRNVMVTKRCVILGCTRYKSAMAESPEAETKSLNVACDTRMLPRERSGQRPLSRYGLALLWRLGAFRPTFA